MKEKTLEEEIEERVQVRLQEIEKAKEEEENHTGFNGTLAEKAMLAKISIGTWEGRKKEKIVEERVDEIYKSEKAGSFWKRLLDSPELKKISNIAQAARDTNRQLTSRWDDGTGILNIELHSEYVKKMRAHKDNFFEAREELKVVYRKQSVDDEKRLGAMYKKSDYPSWEELERKFYFDIIFLPLPTKNDFRVAMQKEEVDRIKKDFEVQYMDTFNKATKELYERLLKVIKKMFETLSDPKKTFHDTLISNVAELVQLLPKLNVAGDGKLTELTKLAEEELASLDPQELRDFPDLRSVTADIAQTMVEELETLL